MEKVKHDHKHVHDYTNECGQTCTNEDLVNLAELFKVLGEYTRLRIIYLLSFGERSVGEIAETIGMGQSAVSHQLRVLRQTRLVTFRKDGKTVWYSLDDEHVELLVKQGLEHVMHD